jgi:hypothetical protein
LTDRIPATGRENALDFGSGQLAIINPEIVKDRVQSLGGRHARSVPYRLDNGRDRRTGDSSDSLKNSVQVHVRNRVNPVVFGVASDMRPRARD